MTASFELYCFPSEWQLSSVDYECLKVINYFQVMQVPYEKKTTRDASISPSDSLPFMRHVETDTVFCGAESILSRVKQNGYNLDQCLNPIERAEIDSYICLLEGPVLDAINDGLWGHDDNFKSFTVSSYARLVTNYSFLHRPYAMSRQRQSYLAQCTKSRPQIERDLKTALAALNERYSQSCISDLLLSSLDIYVYSALSLLKRLPWPHREPASSLTDYPHLVSFMDEMERVVTVAHGREAAPETSGVSLLVKEVASACQAKAVPLGQLPTRSERTESEETADKELRELARQGKWIAAASAAIAVLYVFWSGIVRIEAHQ